MKRAAAVAMLLAAFAAPRPALACSCTVRAPAAYLTAAAAAFRGTVVTVAQDAASTVALFDVAVVYKGDVPNAVSVRTGGDETGCGIPFAEGAAYVVFAAGATGDWTAQLCGGTTEDRAYLDREGVAPVKRYGGEASPAPIASPSRVTRAGRISGEGPARGAPIALAVIAAVASATLLFRSREGRGDSRA